MIVYNLMPYPSFLPIALEASACVGVILFLVFDNDWASLWSWLTSCACFVSLIEPWLFRTSRVMDAEALAPEGQALRRNIFFRMAWHRFIVFKWAPWLDEGVNLT